jgi:hypothetical protein
MKKAISILLAIVFLQIQAYGQLGFLNLSYGSVKTFAEGFNDDGGAYVAEWNGGNSKKARTEAARNLQELINNHEFKEGEQLNIVGFSHGGNVVKEVTTLNLNKPIDNLVFLATPHREDYKINEKAISEAGKIYNFYDTNDWVQSIGGNIIYYGGMTAVTSRILPNRQNLNNVTNIKEDQKSSFWGAHSGMHSDKTVESKIIPEINKKNIR